jgi:nucleotide-binding universal stress UspA family protein
VAAFGPPFEAGSGKVRAGGGSHVGIVGQLSRFCPLPVAKRGGNLGKTPVTCRNAASNLAAPRWDYEVVLEVVVPIPTYIYGAYAFNGATYVDPAWDEEARLSAQTYVDGLATRIRNSSLTVETEVCIASSVATAIADAAEGRGVDLIVMSTDALTGAARAVLGSFADAVVRAARCPVLLLRREPPPVPDEASEMADQQSHETEVVATAT